MAELDGLVRIPATLPGLKPVSGVVGACAIVWLSLEGALIRDILLAAVLLATAMAFIVVRKAGGKTIRQIQTVIVATASGAIFGAGVALLTLVLLAVKTSLHAHGPEYAGWELLWVWRQIPLWSGAGALLMAGFGLILISGKPFADPDGSRD